MVKYPDLLPNLCLVDADERYTFREKCRDEYLAGKQALDEHGDRLWCIIEILVYPEDEYGNLYELRTAEGPLIWCGRAPTGKASSQVEGSPQRNDACAERLVSAIEKDLRDV